MNWVNGSLNYYLLSSPIYTNCTQQIKLSIFTCTFFILLTSIWRRKRKKDDFFRYNLTIFSSLHFSLLLTLVNVSKFWHPWATGGHIFLTLFFNTPGRVSWVHATTFSLFGRQFNHQRRTIWIEMCSFHLSWPSVSLRGVILWCSYHLSCPSWPVNRGIFFFEKKPERKEVRVN